MNSLHSCSFFSTEWKPPTRIHRNPLFRAFQALRRWPHPLSKASSAEAEIPRRHRFAQFLAERKAPGAPRSQRRVAGVGGCEFGESWVRTSGGEFVGTGLFVLSRISVD